MSFPAENCVYTISRVDQTDFDEPLDRAKQLCFERHPSEHNWVWNRTFNGGFDQQFKILTAGTDSFHIQSAVNDYFVAASMESGGLDVLELQPQGEEKKAEWGIATPTEVGTSQDETVVKAWTAQIESKMYPGKYLKFFKDHSLTNGWHGRDQIWQLVQKDDADTWLLQARPVHVVDPTDTNWNDSGLTLEKTGKYFCWARGTVEIGAGDEIISMAHGVVRDDKSALEGNDGVLKNRTKENLVRPDLTPYAMILNIGDATFAPPKSVDQNSPHGTMIDGDGIQFRLVDVAGKLRFWFNDTGKGDFKDNSDRFEVVVTREN